MTEQTHRGAAHGLPAPQDFRPKHSKPPDDPRKAVVIRMTDGLGDCVTFQVAMRHVREATKDLWHITLQTPLGSGGLFTGLCDRWECVRFPWKHIAYDKTVWIQYPRPEHEWSWVPSGKASACLAFDFRELNIEPEEENYFYDIDITPEQAADVNAWADSCDPFVLIHNEGATSGHLKNIDAGLLMPFCKTCKAKGLRVFVLDWNDKRTHPLVASGHAERCPFFETHFHKPEAERLADVGHLAGVIERAEMFLGIDSGPEHIAGATTTPTHILWRFTHPIWCYDLAENVTHYVPNDWPAEYFEETADYFRSRYRFVEYDAIYRPDFAGKILDIAKGL